MTGDAALWLVLWVFSVGAVVSIIYEFAALFIGLPTISTIIRAAVAHFAVTRDALTRADSRRETRRIMREIRNDSREVE